MVRILIASFQGIVNQHRRRFAREIKAQQTSLREALRRIIHFFLALCYASPNMSEAASFIIAPASYSSILISF